MNMPKTLVALVLTLAPVTSFTLLQETREVAGETGSQRALLASYVSSIDGGAAAQTGLSVSNILGAPLGDGFPTGTPESGPITFYLFSSFGTAYVFNTFDFPDVGFGLDLDGNLQPGGTYTVHLSDVFEALFPDRVPADRDFVGYVWVVTDFQGASGTYFNSFPLEGSSQSFTMHPELGGLPVAVQPAPQSGVLQDFQGKFPTRARN